MRKILSYKFNLDTACVELRMDDGMLLFHRLHRCRERGSKQHVPAVGTGLADLQRSAGLCRTGFE